MGGVFGGADLIDSAAIYLYWLKIFLIFVAAGISLNGLDDAFIDVVFVLRTLYRRLFIYTRHPRMTASQLASGPEAPIAILVPAWQESAVIGKMLNHLRKTYRYHDYRIFVGVYLNDPETRLAVEKALQSDTGERDHCPARHAGVTIVKVPAFGPTNKADCLNHIYRGIREFERKTGQRFEIFVLHDAEDVVHPLELRLYNALIPAKDMVQIPVIPLERRLGDLVGGHYLDEFAESHTKDLTVREALTGIIPCAGVGCGFSRRAILSAARGGNPFHTGSLTEDYDFALKLGTGGGSFAFVRMPLLSAGSGMRLSAGCHLIATREFFPDSFRAAVRQKARWLIGIALQGWKSQGWQGGWMQKYMLFRDRKALISAQFNMAAYFIAANIIFLWLFYRLFPEGPRFPPVVEQGDPAWYLLLLNAVFLTSRLFQRVLFVGLIYGWRQGLMTLPRLVAANMINFAASVRALRLYTVSKLTGRPLAWDKTAHAFPTDRQLRPFKTRLGEILIKDGALSRSHLSKALKEQGKRHSKLGEILVGHGWIGPATVKSALAKQRRGLAA